MKLNYWKEVSLPRCGSKTPVVAAGCLPAGSPAAPGTAGGSPEGTEKVLPWAGPLLLSWAGLLAWRELMASGQRCREAAAERT